MLLLSSRKDHVVPSSSGDVLVAEVSGPVERVWLERSYHVATLDYDAELIEDAVVDVRRRGPRAARARRGGLMAEPPER